MTNLEKLNSMTVHELAKIMVENHVNYDYDVYYIKTPGVKEFNYDGTCGVKDYIQNRKLAFNNAVKYTEDWLNSEFKDEEFFHHNDYIELTDSKDVIKA